MCGLGSSWMYFAFGKDVAVLGRVAVQARAHADHDVGFVEELHRRARRVEARDAGVIFGPVGEPRLRAQARADQRADALAELQHRVARARPDRAAADDDHGLLRSSR